MNGPIHFAEINRAALAAFPAVLARILPGGKRVGAEISRSIRAAPIAGSDRSRSIATTAVGRTSPPATKAAIRFRLSPIWRTCRRARRPGC